MPSFYSNKDIIYKVVKRQGNRKILCSAFSNIESSCARGSFLLKINGIMQSFISGWLNIARMKHWPGMRS